MKVVILLVCLVAVAAERSAHFENFKAQFGKKYRSDEEEKSRWNIFKENLKKIMDHNDLYDLGKVSFTLGVNQFADMTTEEFAKQMNGLKSRPEGYKSVKVFEMSPEKSAPATVDWRDHGYVTPVKDQGQCGSCYSFSATGSLEGQNFAKNGKLVSLSEQNIVDCSYLYGNLGCNGGLMDSAFQYVIDNGGIDTEESYPYEEASKLLNCRYSAADIGGTCAGFVDIRAGSEDDLLNAAGSVGPISVAIDASRMSFQLYSSGVYYEPLCSSTQLDHGVLVVGYGTDNGEDFWLVKNSWGSSWGLRGYIQMARNRNNNCGIATQASYPIV